MPQILQVKSQAQSAAPAQAKTSQPVAVNFSPKTNDTALKIVPLGGLHEIGKNTCVFEMGDEILLLDAGLAFPSDGMHGVQIVLPDMTYLRENAHKIVGMVVTHGHEDHIGGIPFHLKQFDIPVIYGPRLAMALLSDKLHEAGVADRTELRTVRPREVVRFGTKFFVEYIRNTHSMADSFTVAIHTPIGTVIHTGDFKIDHTPVDGETFDFQRLAEHGEKGVLCLISDSTNSELPGFTPSERAVYPNLERIFAQAAGRLLVTTFASSVHRVNMILEIAQKQGKVVSVLGRSMLNVIAHARNLGYVKCRDDLFVPIHELQKYPDDRVIILTTGSQGEPLSAMTRIANGEHKQIKIRTGDTVVFSANPIPGNTISVVNTIDKLMMLGAKVVYGRDKGIHVSGHGAQEDQKMMLALTKPKFFLPVHGEHRMLVKHSETAQSMGIPAENMVIIDNGDVVELTAEAIRKTDRVPSGIELVDDSRSGTVSNRALQERQQLASDGILTVATAIHPNGKLAGAPQFHFGGVVSSLNPNKLKSLATQAISQFLDNRFDRFANTSNESRSAEAVDWIGVKVELEREVLRALRREIQGGPQVVVLIQPVGGTISLEAPVTSEASDAGRSIGDRPGPGRRDGRRDERRNDRPREQPRDARSGSRAPLIKSESPSAALPVTSVATATEEPAIAPGRRRRRTTQSQVAS